MALGDWAAAQSKALFSVASTHPPSQPQHSLRCLFFCYFKFRHRTQRRQQTRARHFTEKESARGWVAACWAQEEVIIYVGPSKSASEHSLARSPTIFHQSFILYVYIVRLQLPSGSLSRAHAQPSLSLLLAFIWAEESETKLFVAVLINQIGSDGNAVWTIFVWDMHINAWERKREECKRI